MPGRFIGQQCFLFEQRPAVLGFNPLDAGALHRTMRHFVRIASRTPFQSPRCRGASSDPNKFGYVDGKPVVGFQSPRCRGASSDGPGPGSFEREREVSIPSMPGRFIGPGRALSPGPADVVSIPSMPGRFIGLDTLVKIYHAGLGLVSIPSMPGRFIGRVSPGLRRPGPCAFQSPRCRGASSDAGHAPDAPRRAPGVSIPSMPGRFIGRLHYGPSSRYGLDTLVSIPSMPGRFIGHRAS